MDKKSVSLEELSTTDASADEAESLLMISGLFMYEFHDWARFISTKETDLDVYELAETYVNHHSYVLMKEDPFYTSTPIHVYRCRMNFKIDGKAIEALTECALYSNGAVVLVHGSDKPVTILFIDPKTMSHFNYPEPS